MGGFSFAASTQINSSVLETGRWYEAGAHYTPVTFMFHHVVSELVWNEENHLKNGV